MLDFFIYIFKSNRFILMKVYVSNLMQGALSLDIGRFLTGYGISSFSYVVCAHYMNI